MSMVLKHFFTGLAIAALLTACSESEPYTPGDNAAAGDTEGASMPEVEAPSPPAPPLSFGAMRAAEAAYRASAAYAVYEPSATDPSAPPVVTAAEFDQLEAGMNYEAAMNIIGEHGKVVDESVSGGTGVLSQRYRWLNGDGSYADVTFANKILTSKSQKRLP